MSQDTFEQFRQLVLQELLLQKELVEIDERDIFIARVVELAAEKKLEVTNADVEEALRASRRAWLEKWI